MNRNNTLTPTVKTAIALAFAAALLVLAFGPLPDTLTRLNGDRISAWVMAAGIWGPILVVGLMTIAIVATPIPSAPIALAAGAAYGHTVGTVYIVLGAEFGALAAFVLARFLGRGRIAAMVWRQDRCWLAWLSERANIHGFYQSAVTIRFVRYCQLCSGAQPTAFLALRTGHVSRNYSCQFRTRAFRQRSRQRRHLPCCLGCNRTGRSDPDPARLHRRQGLAKM